MASKIGHAVSQVISAMEEEGISANQFAILKKMLAQMYKVTASYEQDGQVLDCSSPEVLGEAYGMVYSKEMAEAWVEEYQEGVEDSGLKASTKYAIEKV